MTAADDDDVPDFTSSRSCRHHAPPSASARTCHGSERRGLLVTGRRPGAGLYLDAAESLAQAAAATISVRPATAAAVSIPCANEAMPSAPPNSDDVSTTAAAAPAPDASDLAEGLRVIGGRLADASQGPA